MDGRDKNGKGVKMYIRIFYTGTKFLIAKFLFTVFLNKKFLIAWFPMELIGTLLQGTS